MSERSYTPGPWKIFTEFGTYSIGGCLDGRDDFPVAELWRTGKGVQNYEANARLIAAAPEMFELLVDIDNRIGEITEEAWDKLQAIIKRVKGDQ